MVWPGGGVDQVRLDVSHSDRDDLSGVGETRLSVSGDEANAAARSLHRWLVGRDELRGRLRSVEVAPPPGAMGQVPDLVLALGSGVASATASVLISWIRRQVGKVSVTAKRPDGAEITLTAQHVRGLTQQEIGPLVDRLAKALDGGNPKILDVEGPPDGDD